MDKVHKEFKNIKLIESTIILIRYSNMEISFNQEFQSK